MIFSFFFEILLAIFGSILMTVTPLLPSGFNQVFSTIIDYIDTALSFVWVFIPKNLALQLFQWWIVFFSMVLTVELIVRVWNAITGNLVFYPAQAEPDLPNIAPRGHGSYTAPGYGYSGLPARGGGVPVYEDSSHFWE